ncbi:ABC transporter ATP-binding protein [Gottschalkia acidurici 9a]|uniref:ABC transporter ATP-binding protein n=1 Tax=Gottschalkia acidurici (strain ATCC 7906 / DSM 604 / BCRC 14475 / CIP 104303 / KCTC 5404 / NCIMB 10678 / 9a) TaxID=1128398 RepID=K0AX72_GOTA9|nr:ABC transporter ATP-binding protein [Gottschalkia acidurici]AFS77367.1 ABC transporter ATP-binding protein [Gottschalkia acidurici 9a]
MLVLETKELSKVYGSKGKGIVVKALDNFNMNIKEGEFVGVMGPSGSGKTTLLNILATIDSPSSGEVLIGGQNPHKLNEDKLALFRRQNLGFIFQDFNLLDTLSIKENIILPLVLEGAKNTEIEEKLQEISSVLNIKEILNKRTYEVSGGQQQRTACARALINKPSMILADEPTGNLDSKSSYDLMESLEKINAEKKATIVMVTHDAFAASFCNRIIMIKDGKFFLEINKSSSRQVFFKEILDALSLLGGGYNENI